MAAGSHPTAINVLPYGHSNAIQAERIRTSCISGTAKPSDTNAAFDCMPKSLARSNAHSLNSNLCVSLSIANILGGFKTFLTWRTSPSHTMLVSRNRGGTMKQRSILWQAAGFALVTLGGTILHFLYDWTGGSISVAPFSGVNESTWEHMKLLFWPLFLFALFQRLFLGRQ